MSGRDTPARATFRFYGDLAFFLPRERRQKSFTHPIYGADQSVKHLIEAIGPPHTEVSLIVVDGEARDFSYIVQPGERVAVYPPFNTLATERLAPLRPPLPRPVRFLLDNHLGRLARYLRLLGLDALYFNNQYDDEALAQMSHDSGRALLTRDRGLLKRSTVIHGYCLRTKNTEQQVRDVLQRYDLYEQIEPWIRCLRCNGLLRPVAKELVLERLEPKTKLYFDEFQMCEACGQIYWQGSHFGELAAFVERVRQAEDGA